MAAQMLMQLFGFDESDLAANKSGVITPKQEESIRRSATTGLVVRVVITLVVWGFALAVGLPGLASGEVARMIGGGVIGLVGLLILISALSHLGKMSRKRTVSKVEGPGTVRHEISTSTDNDGMESTSHTYILTVSNTRFVVGQRQYEALKDGARYVAYYVPQIGHLLSLEEV